MMIDDRYRVFETAHGVAAIGWRNDRVIAFRLPSIDPREAERAVRRRLPAAGPHEPPSVIAAVIDAAVRYFAGAAVDFAAVPIDLGEQEPLFQRIYAHVRGLGRGETTTYGAIARDLGVGPEYAREVGQAMARNPVPLIVPCHRVLGAKGRVGGFSAPGGADAKVRMLTLEGVVAGPAAAPQAAFDF